MAIRDLEAFLRQQAAIFDPTMDVTPGSPYDVKVIQPLLRRIGIDPFTVDLSAFLHDRLVQAFPSLALNEADALTDLLIKAVTLLWDPIVRETSRIARQNFSDPTTLTLDEATAIGATLFSTAEAGDYSRGVGRLYFSQPQNAVITPANFCTSSGGLHFFPIDTQSIRTEEMLLNQSSDGLYYFDINLIAEQPGDDYNIAPNTLTSIANLSAAVRVENQRRFRAGVAAETVEQYIDRTGQELTERSLVTLRGISSKLTRAFPEIRRLNVVGFGDPEMQRDVIEGGAVGPILADGVAGAAISDGDAKAKTRRFMTAEADFLSLVGPAGLAPDGYVLTVFGAFGVAANVRDVAIGAVINATSIDLVEQDMLLGASGLRWTLRRRELVLSKIPGGILYPDTSSGTVSVPIGEVHIGGAFDVHLHGSAFDDAELILTNVVDDSPILQGTRLEVISGTECNILEQTLDVTYFVDDATYAAWDDAARRQFTLQVLDGPNAGNYTILILAQVSGANPLLTVTPNFPVVDATERQWRLVDELNVNLVEPKETRYSAADLETAQSSDIVTTTALIDFDQYGVTQGDVLRILEGPDAGDYALVANPLAPGYTSIQIDTALTRTLAGLSFTIFRPNSAGGADRPLIRVTAVDVLDASGQPQGTSIPYAKPIDIQSRSFQNPSRGVKHDVVDARLGLTSLASTLPADTYAGLPAAATLIFNRLDGGANTTVTVGGPGAVARAAIVAALNAALLAAYGEPDIATLVGSDRFGLRPIGDGKLAIVGGTAVPMLFGADETYTTSDVRSDAITLLGGWDVASPFVDYTSGLDVLQVMSGNQTGFYRWPYLLDYVSGLGPAVASSGLMCASSGLGTYRAFAPEANVHLQLGSRSLGSVRCYFLEPTSFEVDADTLFTYTTAAGELHYLPDPTLYTQCIPALPNGALVTDGHCVKTSPTPYGVFSSPTVLFIQRGVKAGDRLDIMYIPLGGTAIIADPVPALAGQTFIYSMDDGPERTLIFMHDDDSIAATDVTRAGMVAQINAHAGLTIAGLTAGNTLEFNTDHLLVISNQGTANTTLLLEIAGTAPAVPFVSATALQRSNRSPVFGTYEVTAVLPAQLHVVPPFAADPIVYAAWSSPITRQQFKVHRVGVQRISTTEMAGNSAEAGLYYADIELVSEGTGDDYNINAGIQLTAAGYRSDGYYLRTNEPELSFSTLESVELVISRTILEPGVDDEVGNATQITGQNLRVSYERLALVGDAQAFIQSPTERVVCANPLARSLIPYFVRFDTQYTGGSLADVMIPDIEQKIESLYPTDLLRSSDIVTLLANRGATAVKSPIDLIAIIYNVDRSVWVERSQDAIGVGNLSSFIPDVLNIERVSTL